MADKKKDSKFKVKIPKLNASQKTYDFSLSLPGMISAVGAGVLALTFFFIMGILIGRGYRPETDVPQLNEIMPSKQHGQVAEQPKPEILKPEELEYPERLKEKPETMMAETAPAPAPKPVAKPEPKPEPKVEAKPADAEKPETFTPEVNYGEPVFDYVYQVASFKKADMADALSAKLVAAGLRTNISSGDVKGTTWHRVQVLHHGTPASTNDMKAVLAKFGIKKPLLKKKKAVQ
ncbi:SPOR domain-containing protein [Pseudodesulfovibrio sp. zrk46]|uniref:SPOR domain-containing protein n=1 Tax=Pseudodesulfovibrio sp. zrk46 TaxID=2725288 RepID=UPI001449813E|nr:SPOR domain-containing protein [Pseudodesulfovibrio sp. zrk46]QJB56377.1 SPOR domain-containing protein [Pseudodesulfovibrio sp. zrk46]